MTRPDPKRARARPDVHWIPGGAPFALRYIASSPLGLPMGQSHWNVRHGDDVVEAVREARRQGASYRHIELRFGVPKWTAQAWWLNRRRRPHARVTIKRISMVDLPAQGRDISASVLDEAAADPTPHATPYESLSARSGKSAARSGVVET